jgi:predicted nucleic acid-binding protein
MQKPRAFIDSSTIIFSFERVGSNSALVFDLVFKGEIIGVINEKVVEEVYRRFKKTRGSKWAFRIHDVLRRNFRVLDLKDLDMSKWRGKIKDKDLPHLATVKVLGLEYLVAYDKDFRGFKEYYTPKEFLIKLGYKHFDTDF